MPVFPERGTRSSDQKSDGFVKTHRRRDSWVNQVKSLFSPLSSDRSGNSSPRLLKEELSDLKISTLQQDTSVETDAFLLERWDYLEKSVETSNSSPLLDDGSKAQQQAQHLSLVKSYPIQRGRDRSSPSISSSSSSSAPSPLDSDASSSVGGILGMNSRKIILKRDPYRKIRFPDFACFLDAAWQGDLDEVIKMIDERNVHPDTCNADGVTALHCAAACSYYEMAGLLLSRGAAVNVADDHGWTPLHSAAYNNCQEMVDLLLEHGANVEAVDEQNQTPITLPTDIDMIRKFGEIVTSKNTSPWVTALYDFEREWVENGRGDELNFRRGDRLRILERHESGWWLAELNGMTGYIPRQFVQ